MPPVPGPPDLPGGATAEDAVALPASIFGRGRVSEDARTAWYRLDPPADTLRLVLQMDGEGAAVGLTDRHGADMPLMPEAEMLVAWMQPDGAPYLLKIEKPADAVVVA